MSSSLFSPLTGNQPDVELTNWAGNLSYSTQKLYEAKDSADVQQFVKNAGRLKVLGTRHCFNDIVDSTQQFISLKSLDQVIELDESNSTVTVGGGINYGQLSPYLHAKGFALHNLASLPHISVVGACATATHGSGERNGNLSTAVTAMEIVTYGGELLRLSRQENGDLFNAAVVHLGGLGVVTSITLDIHPTFLARQYVYEKLPLDTVRDHFDAIQDSRYSVSLFGDWANPYFEEVWIKVRENDDFDAGSEFFGARAAVENLHPLPDLSAENCTDQMGVVRPWYEILPHFRMGFTPSSGRELQSEYFVPRRHAVEAIMAVSRLSAQITPHLLTSEIRTVKADDLWLSPCYRQDSVAIHFTWQPDWPSVSKLLPVIERELSPFQVRPHWGKLFTMTHSQLEARYDRLPDFQNLLLEYDPGGKFRNAFLNQIIMGL